MDVKSLFLIDTNDIKSYIRSKIEEHDEEFFENERTGGFIHGAMDFGDSILCLPNNQKEDIRVLCLKDLRLTRCKITGLWEELIDRTAIFQVGIFFSVRILFVLSIILLLCRLERFSLAFFLAFLIVYLFSKSRILFSKVMFLACGSYRISNRLLKLYHMYGRCEAAVYFADYRNLSRIGEEQNVWIFTPSHKKAST